MVKIKAWFRRDSPKPPPFFPLNTHYFSLLSGCLCFAACTLMREYLFRFAVNRSENFFLKN